MVSRSFNFWRGTGPREAEKLKLGVETTIKTNSAIERGQPCWDEVVSKD